MSPKTPFIALILLLSISLNEGLRILLFFPIASKSHSLLGHGVARNLLDAGHEVVHINAYPSENPNPNLKEINVGMVVEEMKRKMEKDAKEKDEDFKLQNLVGKHRNMADSLLLVFLAYELHKQLFTFKPVVDLLSDPEEHFDAVIVEWFFSDVPAGMAPLFKCPLIWMWSSEPYWQLLQLIDEIPNPAFTVDLFSDYQPPLTLCQRMAQVFKLAKNYFIRNIILGLFNRMQYNSVFSPVAAKRGITMPSYSDAIYNGSMLLLNSHPSIGTPFRLPQNAKYIGGYHIDRNVKPLPKDLQKLMDEAKDGVIYFSMGSNLRSADLSDEMKEALFEMFGKLKQTVLWKFETDIKKVPPNVHLLKWAPQPSILSHPNLKIFITHGGQLSTTEAVHFGVPVIGIPVYGDQYINMKSVSKKGFGITLELTDDLVENLHPAINEILVNSSYKEKATQLSSWFHNRLMTPGEELVYWIEYTVATDGAPHLRSPALHVPFYQKMHLDIIAILTIAVTLLVKTVRRLYRMCKGKELDKKKKTQ